jgi:hypothetical protein
MHNFIVSPPNRNADWRRFIEAGTNIQVGKALDMARSSLMSEMTDAAGDDVQDKTDQFRRIYQRHTERYQALCAELSGPKYTTKKPPQTELEWPESSKGSIGRPAGA